MQNLKQIALQPIAHPERFQDGCFQTKLYQEAASAALEKIRANLDQFIDRFPHVSENNVYRPEENQLWTASFFPGLAYLAYSLTQDQIYLKHADEYLKSFSWRLEKGHTQTHDLGFLYTLSCVARYKLTGDEAARTLAIRAAEKLAGRYNPKGRYIQAWKEIGAKYPDVKIIIDTMLNLPLLYWATEQTGDEKFFGIAKAHAITASQYLIRDDGSSFHTYLMNPDTGEAVEGKTHQGRFDDSTWARGQSWAVYGFALSYAYTRDPYFLDVARKTAHCFINNLPGDFVPYWDFSFNDQEPDIRDTSAGAIFVCGLLEMVKYLKEEQDFYLKVAYKVMESLYKNYSTRNNPQSNGLLLHGMYHRNDGADECTIWGDYFYFEALVRLLTKWKMFW